jgi:hypothetical protein
MVLSTRINASLHVVIAKGYKDEFIFYDPQLEACLFVIIQEHAFKELFQMNINC